MTSNVFFESIQKHYTKELPFVVYRKPNTNEVKAMLQNDNVLHCVSDYSESGFVFTPFDINRESILLPLNASEVMSIEDEGHYEDRTISHLLLEPSELEKTQHLNLVETGIDAITKNEFKKVVLSRCETVRLSEDNPIHFFKRLLNNYPTAFVYCWYHPKAGLWLGATPETLLNVEGNRFKTMALAGTQKHEGTLDVIWEEKEKQEQQFVTDFIVESLKEATNTVNVSNATTIKAGNVLHIKTKISGTLNSGLKTILQKLHPTPAVCGMPKQRAKEFIIKNENYDREFYSGFLGELNLKETFTRNTNRRNVENNAYNTVKSVTNLFVNLRCMQLKNNEALIYVGGGITNDSIPENEWQETINKTQTIKAVFN